MENGLKYIKPLFVACMINIGLGAFLFICGFLEFTGILQTPANLSYSTAGIQLSYLIFISGILLLVSGVFTVIYIKSMDYINAQLLIGVFTLAWPIAVTIAMLFLQRVIFIRLIPTILASLFYLSALLVVKIVNEELHKTRKINLQKAISDIGDPKRRQGVNISQSLQRVAGASGQSSMNISRLGNLSQKFSAKGSPIAALRARMFTGKRHVSGGNPLRNMLFSGKRRRGRLRIRK